MNEEVLAYIVSQSQKVFLFFFFKSTIYSVETAASVFLL